MLASENDLVFNRRYFINQTVLLKRDVCVSCCTEISDLVGFEQVQSNSVKQIVHNLNFNMCIWSKDVTVYLLVSLYKNFKSRTIISHKSDHVSFYVQKWVHLYLKEMYGCISRDFHGQHKRSKIYLYHDFPEYALNF